MLKQRLKNIGVGSWFFIIWIALDKASEEPKAWFLQLSPLSVYKLTSDSWLGLLVTLSSSVLAFFFGVMGGYIFGLVASSAVIDGAKYRWFYGIGRNLDRFYDGLYVIPIVLTLSLFYASSLSFTLNYNLPQWPIVIVMIALSGMTLGGYNVYKAVYEAATNPKRESRVLTNSLFFAQEQVKPWLRMVLWRLIRVKKLRDCENHSFCESIIRAFHLSIVAIVILESIVPGFYELMYQQAGIVRPWLGGVGKLIQTARANNEFQTIAGCIWMVLAFDMACIWLLERLIRRRWRRYYIDRS